ncbi:MAG: metal-sulfur cluster assembly factor [Chloroflexota bacterium]|nr:metal-sulfur cluster assembly factor [Chloroflexota bacterium]
MANEDQTNTSLLHLPTSVQEAANEETITGALREVYDPELGINIVDLGLVYDTQVEDRHVTVQMTLTSLGCPAGPQLVQDAKDAVSTIEGVEDVTVDLVWSPAWNPSMMSEDAKLELGYL